LYETTTKGIARVRNRKPLQPLSQQPDIDASRVSTVADGIRQHIEQKVWLPNQRLPTVRKLRTEFGVSSNTVMAALAVLERERLILREHRRGIFVRQPGGNAFNLPVGIVSPFGRFSPDKAEHWSKHVILGCLSELAHRGLLGQLMNIPLDEKTITDWNKLSRFLEESGAEYGGIILTWAACGEAELQDFVKRTKIRIVKIGRHSHQCRHNFISVDHFGAGRLAASHVVDRLPGPFLALSGWAPHAFPRQQLICGFFDRLQQERPRRLLFEVVAPEENSSAEGSTIDAGRKLMTDYLRQNEPPRCVFSVGDELAIGAMEACKEAGLSVPGEVAFIGTSGLDISRACNPTLAHLQQPMEALGSEAVRLLVNMYETEKYWLLGQEMSVKWIDGGSVAPAK
jgi:DNA-binding LacI/PurR family transcriptional regulator